MAVTNCNRCGQRITFRYVNGKPKPISVDGNGQPLRPHVCGAAVAAPAAPAAPAAAAQTAPAGGMPAAAAPNVSGQPSEDDIFGGRGDIPGVDDIFAELTRADEEERERRLNAEPENRPTDALRYENRIESQVSAGFVPERDHSFVGDREIIAALIRTLRKVDRTGTPANIGLWGEAGGGKSTLAVQIGAIRQSPTFICEAAQWETPNDCFGSVRVGEAGELSYNPSALVRGLETAGATVIINDLANVQSLKVQSGLNDLCDPSTRSTYVEALGRQVRVAAGVVIVASWNVGDEYTAASPLSRQLIDRFRAGTLIEVPYPTNGTLTAILTARTGVNDKSAKRLADVADWLRADPNPIFASTRGLIAAADQIVDGATIGQALAFTIFGDLDPESRGRAYQIIDVKLRGASEAERGKWRTPIFGQFAGLYERDLAGEYVSERGQFSSESKSESEAS